MKYKRSIFGILFIAVNVLIIGLIVAYYNTASLGYDNANILSIYDDKIKIFDINIYYTYIHYIYSYLKQALTPITF